MKNTSKDLFIDIQLKPETVGFYVVRKNIFNNIKRHSHLLNGELLDVGSGTAPYKEYILGLGTVKRYTTLDFNNGYEGVQPDMHWNGTKIPMPDESFDSVLCTEVFEHCSNIEQILSEIRRVLRPGGVLIFTVPFLWPLHLIPHDEYRYTPYSLTRHLNNAGFTDFDLSPLGGFDASLAQMISIWVAWGPLSPRKRKFAYYIVKPIIYYLSKRDKMTEFYGGAMITGILGVVRK